MATTREYVYRALAKLGVKSAETTIEASELNDGIETFNDMMTELEGSGILLGFVAVNSGDDEVRVPREAKGAIIANLAVRLASDYSRPVTAELAAEVKASTNNLLRSIVKLDNVAYPSTLPMGSGNRCYEDDETFFTEESKVNF